MPEPVAAALAEQRDRYQDLFEFAPDAYLVTDAEGHVLEANRVAETLLDVRRDVLIGGLLVDHVAPRGRPVFRAELERMAETGRVQDWTVPLLTGTGAVVEGALTVTPVRTADGKLVALRWMLRDVARGALAEERARVVAEDMDRRVVERAERFRGAGRETDEGDGTHAPRGSLAFLSQASELLAASLDYQATLNAVAQLVVPFLADWCLVDILSVDGRIEQVAVAHVDPAKVPLAEELRRRFPPDWSRPHPITRALRTGLPEVEPSVDEGKLEEIGQDPRATELLRQLGLGSHMVVPLTARGRTFGVISFISGPSGRAYGSSELALAEDLCRRAALAVDNARLYEAEQQARQAAERAAERTTILYGLGRALAETMTPAEVAEVVVDRGIAALGAAAGAMALVVPPGRELQIVRAIGYDEAVLDRWRRFPLSAATPLSEAVRDRAPVFVESRDALSRRYPDVVDSISATSAAWAAVPFLVEGRAIGGLAVSFAEPRRFSDDERAFMLSLARQTALAVERAQLYESERAARAEAEAAQRRLAFLAEAGPLLAASLDYEATLGTLARLCVPALADWCSIDMLGEDGSIRQLALAHSDPEKVELARELRRRYPVDLQDPSGVANVVRTGRSELYPDITDEMLDQMVADPERRRIARELGLRSVMVVPLVARNRTLGTVTFIAAESDRRYGATDLALAEDLARRAALAVDNALLYRERDYVARTLQQSLLPPELPAIPGVEVAARYRPAGVGNEVGGDFYDVFDTGDVCWGLLVGDVRGKGADAAAVMGLARHTIRATAMYERRPSRILYALNEAIRSQAAEERFCTVVYVRLKEAEGGVRLTISCGGHPLPIVLRADGAMESVARPGTLLGLLPDPNLSDQVVDLSPGDLIVMYTDGVTEERANGSFFGEARLGAIIADSVGLSAGEVAQRIEDGVLGFAEGAPRDDLAVLVLRVLPREERGSTQTATG